MIANIQEVAYSIEVGNLEKLCYQHSDQAQWNNHVTFLYDVMNYTHDLCAASFQPGAAGAGSGLEDLKVEVASFRPGAPAAGSALEVIKCLEVLNVEVASFRPGAPAAGNVKRRGSELSA